MDTPRDDVGRHQCIDFALGERVQSSLALPLGAVAMHGDRTDTVGLELLDDPVGAALGTTEHEGLPVVSISWP